MKKITAVNYIEIISNWSNNEDRDNQYLLKESEEFHKSMIVNEAFDKNISDFKKLPLKQQKKLLLEVLDKNQLYVNKSEIDDADFKVGKEDKEMNKEFYGKK